MNIVLKDGSNVSMIGLLIIVNLLVTMYKAEIPEIHRGDCYTVEGATRWLWETLKPTIHTYNVTVYKFTKKYK